MMKIITFLLDNIFFAVIIMGAVASLYRKMGSKKQTSQMPDFGDAGLTRRSAPETERGPQATSAEAAPAPVYRSQVMQGPREKDPSGSRKESLTEEPKALSLAALEHTVQRVPTPKLKAGNTAAALDVNKRLTDLNVKPEDLRRAVVWSEILGPPRSKRSYRK